MRIGIDIDGVLTNIEQYVMDNIPKFCIENNIEYNVCNIDYNHNKTFNITKEQEMDFWDKNLESYAKNEKARPFASEIIEKLKKDGFEIYIISARWLTNRDDEVGDRMRGIVKNWLYENKISYDKLVFSKAEKENKFQEIIEFKIDLMIEDSPSNINEISNMIPVICYNAEYNKECVGNNIIRCYSWYDIYKKINELENILN